MPAHRHPVPLSWFRFPVAISPSLVSVDNCRQQWYVRKCRGNSSLYFLNSSVPHRIENEPMLICTLGSCRSADVKQNSSAVKCPIPTGGASPDALLLPLLPAIVVPLPPSQVPNLQDRFPRMELVMLKEPSRFSGTNLPTALTPLSLATRGAKTADHNSQASSNLPYSFHCFR